MAKFNKVIVTDIGLNLIATAIREATSIEITSVKVGNGSYLGTEILENAISLVSEKNMFSVSNLTSIGNNTIKVRADLANTNVLVGYNITEIGIYAKNSSNEEILFAITTAIESDFFPDYESAPTTILLELYISMSNSENVNFTYTIPSGVYATLEEIEKMKQDGVKANGGNADTLDGKHANDFMSKDYTATLLSSGWVGESAPYTQNVGVAGITSDDYPFVDIVLSPTLEIAQNEEKEYGKISKIIAYDGYIIATCNKDKPSFDLNLKFRVVR